MVNLTVRYFAVLRERRQRDEEALAVPAGTTVAALYDQLFPAGPQGRLPVAYVRNLRYAEPDEVVEDGDEVAFLPPLGGG